MKALLIVVALLLLVTVSLQAQVPASTFKIWTAKAYAASQSDTSSGYAFAGANVLSVLSKYDDSVYVITLVQYSKDGGTTYSFIAGDTLNQTGGGVVTGSTYRELLLRGSATDNIAGVGGLIRVIQKFQATLCGVTTPTYRTWFYYRP